MCIDGDGAATEQSESHGRLPEAGAAAIKCMITKSLECPKSNREHTRSRLVVKLGQTTHFKRIFKAVLISESANPYYTFRCLSELPTGRSRPERRLNITQNTNSWKRKENRENTKSWKSWNRGTATFWKMSEGDAMMIVYLSELGFWSCDG